MKRDECDNAGGEAKENENSVVAKKKLREGQESQAERGLRVRLTAFDCRLGNSSEGATCKTRNPVIWHVQRRQWLRGGAAVEDRENKITALMTFLPESLTQLQMDGQKSSWQ